MVCHPPIEIPDFEAVEFHDGAYEIDAKNHIILLNTAMPIESSMLNLGDHTIIFDDDIATLNAQTEYAVTIDAIPFKLYLSERPIIHINTGGEVVPDAEKLPMQFKVFLNAQDVALYDAAIEVRGGTSTTHPKQSYSFELREAPDSLLSVDASLLDMREDDDWILDGLWNEPMRIRDFLAHDIWASFGRVPDSIATNDNQRQYVELFINGSYRGLYYLGERMDRKLLDLVEYDGTQRGELIKAEVWDDAVLFEGAPEPDQDSKSWSGFEMKYPKLIQEQDWQPFHDFVSFVVNSSDTEFEDNISQYLDLDNAVDYFIFLNLIGGDDNKGKNLYFAKYDRDTPYFILPWDMDGTFGNNWTGEQDDIGDILLTNGLFDRLWDMPFFQERLKNRWGALRTEQLDGEQLNRLFAERHTQFKDRLVYDREQLNEDLRAKATEGELIYLTNWLSDRLSYLDTQFY